MVKRYQGVVYGREHQPLKWVKPEQLYEYHLPPADQPILTALLLPEIYVILDADHRTSGELCIQIKKNLLRKRCLFLLRGKSIDSDRYKHLAIALLRFCEPLNVRLLLNSSVEQVTSLGAAGLHLSANAVARLERRSLDPDLLFGVSCHNAAELRHAQYLNADFAVLSPVHHTQSHPQAAPLGWEQFSALVDQVNVPVFALGGLGFEDIAEAKQRGAQGVSGISAFQ